MEAALRLFCGVFAPLGGSHRDQLLQLRELKDSVLSSITQVRRLSEKAAVSDPAVARSLTVLDACNTFLVDLFDKQE
jgi:hypothetical protein